MSRRSIHRVVLAALPFVLLATACGGSSSTTTAADAATTTAAADAATTTAAAGTTTASGDDRVVEPGDMVSVHYTGTLDDGTVFDSSVGGATLDFEAGAGQMIPGFDAAVIGMAVGEKKTVTLSPEEAYGERDENLVIEVSPDQVPEDVAVGQQLVDDLGNTVEVIEVNDDVVVLDANHPLAGESLTFEIELVSIN